MKDTFYFSHDYNARSDEKIKKLIRSHGMKGYGIFWSIVEDLYNNANALPADYDGIAYDLRVERELVESVISGFDLFSIEDGYFGSMSVARRLEERNKKSELARQSAFKRWEKKKIDTNALQSHCEGNAIKESIVKDKKEKKEKKETQFLPPSLSEVIAYCLERKNNVDPETWHAFYESKGWMVGRNKMIDWRAAVRTWEKESRTGQKRNNSETHIKETHDSSY